jgi:hypothetical protein
MRGEAATTAVKRHALTILHALEEADAQLVGKAVVLTDGTAGTVEAIWLDDLHGLRISIKGHAGKRPVSALNSRKARCRPDLSEASRRSGTV